VRPLRVLTWHVHGSYLWYLSFADVDWYLPERPGGARQWPANVHAVTGGLRGLADAEVDCVLFQSVADYREWAGRLRHLPQVYLEHDPPRDSPFDTRHPVTEADPDVLIVHCTAFNRLMWDCGESATTVVEHGVSVPPEVKASGELERGLVVVNNLGRRGRRLGLDVFEAVRAAGVPLDLVGMGSEVVPGGLGEVPPPDLPAFAARYRFLFNPIRWTSLGLAVLEAMAVGVPVVGLATTELSVAVENGLSGWLDTDVDRLVGHMRRLLDDPAEARRLGEGARERAATRYGIDRFSREWETVLGETVEGTRAGQAATVDVVS
jgi:hypothetical protein